MYVWEPAEAQHEPTRPNPTQPARPNTKSAPDVAPIACLGLGLGLGLVLLDEGFEHVHLLAAPEPEDVRLREEALFGGGLVVVLRWGLMDDRWWIRTCTWHGTQGRRCHHLHLPPSNTLTNQLITLRPAPSRSFSVNSFPLVVMTYTGGAPDEGEDEEDEEERRWRMPEKFPLWRTRRGKHVNPPEATVLSSPTHAYGRTVQGAGVEVVLP